MGFKKQAFLKTSILAVLILPALLGCQSQVESLHSNSSSNSLGGQEYFRTNSHTEFFGFWASSSFFGDALSATQAYTNISFIFDTAAMELTYLAEIPSTDMKAIVVIPGGIFFDGGTLDPNWQTNWNTFASQVAPYEGRIEAFYPLDEPYRAANGDYTGMLTNLETVGAAIKTTFPKAKLAMLFAGPDFTELATTNLVPKNYDWIGFDCYGSYSNCQGHSIPWYLSQVKANLYADQRTFLMPNSSIFGTVTQSQIDNTTSLIRSYFQLAAEEPSVVGLFPFMYYDYNAAPDGYWTGAENLPEILSLCEGYGTSVKNSFPFTNPLIGMTVLLNNPVEKDPGLHW